MKRAPAIVGVVALLAVLLAPRAARADATGFAFGFTDQSATRLVVLNEPGAPRYTSATCDHGSGGSLTIEYVGHQRGAEPNPARATAAYFDQQRGDVYKLPSGADVSPNQTCLLMGEGAVAWRMRFFAKRSTQPCGASTKKMVSQRTKQAVAGCWSFGFLSTSNNDTEEVFTAVMRRQGKRVLAVLGARSGKTLALREYAAECGKDDPSCWRADDGGKWAPDSFRMLDVVGLESGRVTFGVAITWGGPEGETAMLLPLRGGEWGKPLVETYRYWSPE